MAKEKDSMDLVGELGDKLTDDELDVANILDDYIDTLPSDFFKQSVEDLNKHFGGHDNLVVTENVRAYMDAYKRALDEIDEIAEMFPADDEDDEDAEIVDSEGVLKDYPKDPDMANGAYWRQENKGDKVWWLEQPDTIGEMIFSFDKKKKFHLYRDYSKMTPEEKEIFDKENPYWARFFSASDKDESRDKDDDEIQDEDEFEMEEMTKEEMQRYLLQAMQKGSTELEAYRGLMEVLGVDISEIHQD